MKEIEYQRELVKNYAEQWAYLRNPAYYNYDLLGGDCTNFVSQCIFHGAKVMNYEKNNGWYYTNANQKSPSWTGVEFLYRFLTKNQAVGPYGKLALIEEIQIGDIIQLSFEQGNYAHSLVVVKKDGDTLNDIYTSSHTFDSYKRRLNTYSFIDIRMIHIQGVRNW